jgi:hypothetical protein
MEHIECSETSANIKQTPGKHPKENTLNNNNNNNNSNSNNNNNNSNNFMFSNFFPKIVLFMR